MRCGRRSDPFTLDLPGSGPDGEDEWREESNPYRMGPTCSYCGSLSPEALFASIEAGHELGPTDKNYKLYVEAPTVDPEALRVSSGASNGDEPPSFGDREHWHLGAELTDEQLAMLKRDGWREPMKWVYIGPVGPTRHGKFYFQHFSVEEQGRFLALVNAGEVRFGYPGRMYVMPYFARPSG